MFIARSSCGFSFLFFFRCEKLFLIFLSVFVCIIVFFVLFDLIYM